MRSPIIAFIALTLLSQSAYAQSRANSSSTSPSGRYVAIGCLSKQGTGAAARYQLTDPRGEKPTTYRLQGDAGELERHVGHTVEAAGSLAPAAAAGPYSLKVASVVYLAARCSTEVTRSGVRP